MKRLSPDKRNQLIAIGLATLAVLGGVYSLLISPQNAQIRKLASETALKRTELQKIKDGLKQSDAIASALVEITKQLNQAEEDVAKGDVYAWTYDTLRRFKATYHVDIPNIGQPSFSDVDLIPNFPYKQVKLSLTGTAYYQDLGKFIADFENTFPHMRLVNVAIESLITPGGAAERLSFRMDVVTLVKPNT